MAMMFLMGFGGGFNFRNMNQGTQINELIDKEGGATL